MLDSLSSLLRNASPKFSSTRGPVQSELKGKIQRRKELVNKMGKKRIYKEKMQCVLFCQSGGGSSNFILLSHKQYRSHFTAINKDVFCLGSSKDFHQEAKIPRTISQEDLISSINDFQKQNEMEDKGVKRREKAR